MSDLFIDPLTDDIGIDAVGRVRLTATIPEDAAQRLRCKLRWFLGSWFLAVNKGLPFFQIVLIKNPSLPAIRSALTKVITSDVSVDRLQSLELELDGRSLSVTFAAMLISGEQLATTLGIQLVAAEGNVLVLDDDSEISL